MSNRRDLTDRKSREQRKLILAASNGICCICKEAIDMTLSGMHPMGPIREHIIPVARGGDPTDVRNAGVAHRKCGLKKGTKLQSELGTQSTKTQGRGTRQWI